MIDNITTYLAELIHHMVQSYWGGVFFLFFGIYFIRNAVKERTLTSNYLRGWAAGIGGVIGGLLIIIFKLTGKI